MFLLVIRVAVYGCTSCCWFSVYVYRNICFVSVQIDVQEYYISIVFKCLKDRLARMLLVVCMIC
jgi:hypothetical protein